MSGFRLRLHDAAAVRLLPEGLEVSAVGDLPAQPALHPPLVVGCTRDKSHDVRPSGLSAVVQPEPEPSFQVDPRVSSLAALSGPGGGGRGRGEEGCRDEQSGGSAGHL